MPSCRLLDTFQLQACKSLKLVGEVPVVVFVGVYLVLILVLEGLILFLVQCSWVQPLLTLPAYRLLSAPIH